jgi:hypothetical protein
MDEYFDKVGRAFLIITAPFIIIFIIWMMHPRNCKKEAENDRKVSCRYHIDTMYISDSHATPMVFVTGIRSGEHLNHVGLEFAELRDLYNNASIGDSIYKDMGSLEYKLIKKDTVLSFYVVCNGEKMR